MILQFSEKDRILVVAPHPDDESIGCGGLLASYPKQCEVLLLTDGYDREHKDSSIADIRKKEFVSALNSVGIKNYYCLDIPEHKITDNIGKIKTIDFSKYSAVFVPNRYELHIDHKFAFEAVKSIIGLDNPLCKLYEYEVWTTIREPNILLDIESVKSEKEEMINCHISQVKELDYVGLALGLNSYRGKTHGMNFAEAYYCEYELKAEKKRHLKRKIKGLVKPRR